MWLSDNIFEAFGPYLGYNRDELGRMKDCQDYGCRGQEYIFPLIEWNWSRDDCVEYIYFILGVLWHKSCCMFCPFQSKDNATAHYRANQQAAGFAMWVEFIAMAFNPRMLLFARRSVLDLCIEAGLDQALANLEQRKAETEWAVYRVRRIYRHVGNPAKPRVDAARNVERVATGTQEAMNAALQEIADRHRLSTTFDGHLRCYSHVRDEEDKVYPAIEGFWVVAPAVARDKCYRKNFDLEWRKLVQQEVQKTAKFVRDVKRKRK